MAANEKRSSRDEGGHVEASPLIRPAGTFSPTFGRLLFFSTDCGGEGFTSDVVEDWGAWTQVELERSNTIRANCDQHSYREIIMTIIRPPFTLESATAKVRFAEDAWNSRDPQRVSLAYTPDSEWRNRGEFLHGRDQIRAFLTGKWERELDYRLVKSLWSFTDNQIAVRFQYEYRNDQGLWFRAYGNELWEFDAEGLMQRREASINDVAILPEDRRFHWPAPGPRPIEDSGIPAVR